MRLDAAWILFFCFGGGMPGIEKIVGPAIFFSFVLVGVVMAFYCMREKK